MFFSNFILKKVTVTICIISYFFRSRSQKPGAEAGAGFEICLEPEPKNQKRTGSGNADFKKHQPQKSYQYLIPVEAGPRIKLQTPFFISVKFRGGGVL